MLFWAWTMTSGVGDPGLLKLVEQQLVALVEVEPESLVEFGDDLRQVLDGWLVLLASAFPEDGADCAESFSIRATTPPTGGNAGRSRPQPRGGPPENRSRAARRG